MKYFVAVIALLACSLSLQAQTAPTGAWQLGANFSSVSGPTSNGQMYFVARQFGNRVFGVAKVFTLANPSGVVIVTASPRYQLPFNAFWKPNSYFDTSKLALNLDANIGASKDSFGTSRFAYGAAAGLDYRIANNVTINAFEIDYMRSKMLPNGNLLIVVNNLDSISMGVSFKF